MSTSPRVVVVTGASRGAGKGIALALGSLGDIVYVTGRSKQEGDAPLPGTVYATAEEVTARGGTGIAAIVDHGNDQEVKALFEKIKAEHGRVDILVNNAVALHDDLIKSGPFWEKSIDLVNIIDVGLRSDYIAAYYAAQIMAEQKSGMIINTSSPGAACYMHGAAYGAQKAGCDKMIWDMAYDLKPFNVKCFSIWMGVLQTERLKMAAEMEPEKYGEFFNTAETPEFTGQIISALYNDESSIEKSGQAFISAEIAQDYDIKDVDGKQPMSHREMLGGPQNYNPAVVE